MPAWATWLAARAAASIAGKHAGLADVARFSADVVLQLPHGRGECARCSCPRPALPRRGRGILAYSLHGSRVVVNVSPMKSRRSGDVTGWWYVIVTWMGTFLLRLRRVGDTETLSWSGFKSPTFSSTVRQTAASA